NLGLRAMPMAATPFSYAGPLRVSLSQIVRRIQYENNLKECVLEVEIAWEPRFSPIVFELKPDDLEVVDDLDRKIAVEVDERRPMNDEPGTIRAEVDRSMVRTDFIVHLAQPQKGAEKIKLMRGKLTVVMPADLQTFDFSEPIKAKNE